MFQSKFSTTLAFPPERSEAEISSVIVPRLAHVLEQRLQDGKLQYLGSLHPPQTFSGNRFDGKQLIVDPMEGVRDGFGAHRSAKFARRLIAGGNRLGRDQRTRSIVNRNKNRPSPGKCRRARHTD